MRRLRIAIDVVMATVIVASIAFAALAVIGPRLGITPVVLRGNSMAPTAPVGSLVIARSVAEDELAPGDIVTFRTDRGTYVTHRITRLVERPDGLYLETKGDANATTDPQIFTASHVIGRAVAWAPGVGYVLDIASIPSLWLAVIGALVSLYLVASMLDSMEATRVRERSGGPSPAA